MGEYAAPAETVDGAGMRFGVVVSRFNEDITAALLEGARRTFAAQGVADDDVTVVFVPGAFELPLIAQHLARGGTVDGVVCLGAVIRGDTPHFEYVAGEAARGLQAAALATGVPDRVRRAHGEHPRPGASTGSVAPRGTRGRKRPPPRSRWSHCCGRLPPAGD